MPLSPEQRARYPANWASEIRPSILLRANSSCERCNARNRTTVFRWVDQGDAYYMYECGAVYCAETGEACGYARIYDLPSGRYVQIVLTIAHLHDPDPANCDPANLAALCQRCHLQLDAPMHRVNAAATRRAKAATPDMFDAAGSP